jgi:hypothetical protein
LLASKMLLKAPGQFHHDRQVHTDLIGKWLLDRFDYFGTGCAPGRWDPEHRYDISARNFVGRKAGNSNNSTVF